MTHPRYELQKTYIATVEGKPDKRSLELLRNGIFIDGYKTKEADVKMLKNYEEYSVIKVTICEGRNRQVKKMFEKINHPVRALKRIKFGNIELRGLNPGDYRKLNDEELNYLEKLKNESR